MKIRMGFVSNSSSSSFVVAQSALTEDQINRLLSLDYVPLGQYRDRWSITDDGRTIRGWTSMDNGMDEDGMEAWLKEHNYPMNTFNWSD